MVKSNLGLDIAEGIKELPEKPIQIRNAKSVLIISDLHFPFHDKRAIETAVNYRDNIDCIIILGDMLDMYQGSKFDKDPSYKKIQDEIEIGKKFLEYLRGKFKNAQIIFLEGNHDVRLKLYLWRNAAALAGVDALKLESLLDLIKYNVKFCSNGNILQLGGLHLIHGNEARVGGGINVARSMMLRTFDNIMFGHFHKRQTFDEVTINGKEFAAWSIGCLCQLRPQFLPLAKWAWGFGIIELSGNDFEVSNKRILKDYNVV